MSSLKIESAADIDKVEADMLLAYTKEAVKAVISNPYEPLALVRLEAWCMAHISNSYRKNIPTMAKAGEQAARKTVLKGIP